MPLPDALISRADVLAMLATMDATNTPSPERVVMLTLSDLQERWQCDRRTVLKLVPLGLPMIRFPFGYRARLTEIEVFEQRHRLK